MAPKIRKIIRSSKASVALNPTLQKSMALVAVKALAYIPFRLRSALGWSLGYLFGVIPSREHRLAKLQIRLFIPKKSAFWLTPRVFANAGQTLLESISLAPILKNADCRIRCDSWDLVEQWEKDARPIIALTAHTGNWDLLAAYVISRGIHVSTIGREARNQAAQTALSFIREGYGIETIWRSDRAGLKRLFTCLKERRVVAALIDQDTQVESISIPFFGAPAKTPVSLITLGEKMNARFVTAFIFREGWGRFRVFIDEIPDLTSPESILCAYNSRLEELIRQYPAQWVWFHKRWRTTPTGKTLSSREYIAELQRRISSSL